MSSLVTEGALTQKEFFNARRDALCVFSQGSELRMPEDASPFSGVTKVTPVVECALRSELKVTGLFKTMSPEKKPTLFRAPASGAGIPESINGSGAEIPVTR